MATSVENLAECATICTLCADDCLSEPDVTSLLPCVSALLDCAAICAATIVPASRQTEPRLAIWKTQLDACAMACRKCAEECDRHAARKEHCRLCAEVCRRCEAACRALL